MPRGDGFLEGGVVAGGHLGPVEVGHRLGEVGLAVLFDDVMLHHGPGAVVYRADALGHGGIGAYDGRGPQGDVLCRYSFHAFMLL